MDVPDSTLKGIRRWSISMPVGLTPSLYAATMLTPGAVISGYDKKKKKSLQNFMELGLFGGIFVTSTIPRN